MAWWGANSADWSTLFLLLLGMLEPDNGAVQVLGRSPGAEFTSLRQRGVGAKTPVTVSQAAENLMDLIREAYANGEASKLFPSLASATQSRYFSTKVAVCLAFAPND